MFGTHTRQVTVAELQRGDLVLYAPDGKLGAALIDLFTHSHYHHVALFDDEDMVIEAMPGGVRRAPIGSKQVIGIHLDLLPPQKFLAVAWAKSKIGDPYDTRGVILIGIDRVFPHLRDGNPTANRYTCAVFVSEAYHHAGIDLLPGRDWNDLVPGDFLQLLHQPAQFAVPD
jgi:uncharacterized protein YycO